MIPAVVAQFCHTPALDGAFDINTGTSGNVLNRTGVPESDVDKLSKNVEMTHERHRSYDRWRRELEQDFRQIPFVEYQRVPNRGVAEWPLFRITASIHPVQTNSPLPPDEHDWQAIVHAKRDELQKFNECAKWTDLFPFYVALMNSEITSFYVQQMPRKDANGNIFRHPTLYDQDQFAQEILKQQLRNSRPVLRPHDSSFDAYSEWHREALPGNAGTMDIDYVEVRRAKPAAIVEVTQANTEDLLYGLFSFLSRGFAQAAVLVQLAEELRIPAYVLCYPEDLSEVELLNLGRPLIPKIDEIDRLRQQIAKRETDRSIPKRIAQGKATSELYRSRGGDLLNSLLSMRRRMHIKQYATWLSRL
jgi:hypothetical protein